MRIEIIIFGIAAFLMANVYTDGKYWKLLQTNQKYYKMAGIALGAMMIYVLFKKFPILYSVFFSKYINYNYNFIFVQDLYWFSKTNLGRKKYLWIQNNLNKVADSKRFENQAFISNIDKLEKL